MFDRIAGGLGFTVDPAFGEPDFIACRKRGILGYVLPDGFLYCSPDSEAGYAGTIFGSYAQARPQLGPDLGLLGVSSQASARSCLVLACTRSAVRAER